MTGRVVSHHLPATAAHPKDRMNPSPNKVRRARKWLLVLALVLVVGVLSGCQTLSFYKQAIKGQYEIVAHQQPIEKLLADPQAPTPLRDKLQLLQNLGQFAEQQLKLPVDGHYRKYVD